MLSINVNDPLSLPECRFLGSDTEVNFLRNMWKRNCKRWTKDKSFPENLACVFENQLPQPPHVQRMRRRLNVAFVMLNIFPQMMNLVPGVEVQLIIHVKMEVVSRLSTVFVLAIGFVP